MCSAAEHLRPSHEMTTFEYDETEGDVVVIDLLSDVSLVILPYLSGG